MNDLPPDVDDYRTTDGCRAGRPDDRGCTHVGQDQHGGGLDRIRHHDRTAEEDHPLPPLTPPTRATLGNLAEKVFAEQRFNRAASRRHCVGQSYGCWAGRWAATAHAVATCSATCTSTAHSSKHPSNSVDVTPTPHSPAHRHTSCHGGSDCDNLYRPQESDALPVSRGHKCRGKIATPAHSGTRRAQSSRRVRRLRRNNEARHHPRRVSIPRPGVLPLRTGGNRPPRSHRLDGRLCSGKTCPGAARSR